MHCLSEVRTRFPQDRIKEASFNFASEKKKNVCHFAVYFLLPPLTKTSGLPSFFTLSISLNSLHNTPILGLKSQTEKWRLVQDLQKINEAVLPLHPVVPNVYTLFSHLNKQIFFSH